MKKNNSAGASALHVTLFVIFLSVFAIVFASTFHATAQAASNQQEQQLVAQSGFYPPLPVRPAPDQTTSRPTGVTPTCTPKEVDDKIATGDPKQLGRLVPGGVPSSCGAPNSCNTTPGMFHYKSASFTNDTGGDRCVTATLSTSCTGSNAIFAAAYLGGFDPSNICTNLIGDIGIVSNGSANSFSFNVPAGQSFDVVVNEVTANAGCGGYKLEIFGLCAAPTPTPGVCPLTIGYWKNHPSAWPVTSLTLGAQTYTQAELLAILGTPSGGDASVILAKQLIAAKLNVAHGSSNPAASTISHADTLLSGFSGKLPYHVHASTSTGQAMVSDSAILDSFNNGAFTPGCSS